MPRYEDDDDEDRPRRRRPRDDEDDEDERPWARRKARPVGDDEDEDRPRPRRRSRYDEDDDDDRPRRKARPKAKQPSAVGTIAVVIALIALGTSFIPCFASKALIPAGIGLIVGFVGLMIAHNSDGRQSSVMPITGMSISAVAVVIGIGWLVLGKQVEKKLEQVGANWEKEAARVEAERKASLATAAGEVQNAANPIRITAGEFYHAYEKDTDVGDFKYKNKVLEVTGVFKEVDFTGEDGYVVMLVAGTDEFETVNCTFAKDPAVRERLARLRPGQSVTIRGKCLGGDSDLEACLLVN